LLTTPINQDKFFQIVDGGKAFAKWIGGGFSRFIEHFKAENKFLGKTNWLALLDPTKTLPLLGKSFFPPSEETAEIGSQAKNNDAESVSESASYEDGADTTVVLDAGGEESSAPSSSVGKSKIIPLTLDKQTIVNSHYEMQSNAVLYKV